MATEPIVIVSPFLHSITHKKKPTCWLGRCFDTHPTVLRLEDKAPHEVERPSTDRLRLVHHIIRYAFVHVHPRGPLFQLTHSLTAGGAWTTGLLVKIKLFSRKPELHWPALVWFLSACVADVMITIVLVLTLVRWLVRWGGGAMRCPGWSLTKARPICSPSARRVSWLPMAR